MKTYDPLEWARRLMNFRSEPSEDENRLKLEEALKEVPGMQSVLDELSQVDCISEQLRIMSAFDTEKALRKVKRPRARRRLTVWVGAAAAVALVASFILLLKSDPPERMAFAKPEATVEGVTLQLADGSVLGVDTMDAYQSGTGLSIRNSSGLLSVLSDGKPVESKVLNKLQVPVHTTYSMVLPDGSKVWLNAGSSLEFPTAFSGENRRVRLVGEAYFEVTHDASRPFVVQNSGPDVVVLGTRFNLRSYPDEKMVAATLESGSIALKEEGKELVKIVPGQQTRYNLADNSLEIQRVETDRYTAWKSGLFWFEDAPLRDIMNRIGRWYGMDVVFDQSSLKHVIYSGKMKMYDRVDDVLVKFNKSGDLQFRQSEGCIHVSKISSGKE